MRKSLNSQDIILVIQIKEFFSHKYTVKTGINTKISYVYDKTNTICTVILKIQKSKQLNEYKLTNLKCYKPFYFYSLIGNGGPHDVNLLKAIV